jgi:Glycosyl hydrolases family 18
MERRSDMKLLPARPRVVLAAAVATAVLAGPVTGIAAASQAAATTTGQARPAGARDRLLPRAVYAPYFEAWTKDSIVRIARRSGARFFTLAFLQTARRGSCTLTWNGYRSQRVARGGRYTAQARTMRAMGGNVIPSFGGYSADHDGEEIADSCHSVKKIARAYESVVTTYGVTRLDMDVEDRSLSNAAGIARRSAAMRLLQEWAARHHRQVQIVLTLGVEPSGLPGNCLAVLKSAVTHGVRVTAVNVLAFDYYNSNSDSDMGTEAKEALRATHKQLTRLFPHRSSRSLWAMEGVTLLPGIDDFPKKTEVTYPSEAQDVLYFAKAHRLRLISIWAIQRDNGRCPGVIDSNSCSGITQRTWQFSHLLAGFTR